MFRSLLRIRKCFSEFPLQQKLRVMSPINRINLQGSIKQNHNLEQSTFSYNMKILKQGSEAAQYLNALDSITLDNICKQFLAYTKDTHTQVKSKINDIVGNQQKASKILTNLEIIYGILEQSNFFLKGDIHSYSLNKIEQYFNEVIDKNKVESYFDERQMFEDLFNLVTSAKIFRLPKLGILDPTLENQKNLFERQLILEDESSSIALKKHLEGNKFLSQIGRGHQSGKIKQIMTQWLPDLVLAFKQHQQYVRISQRQQQNQQGHQPTTTNSAICRLKPSKLASVCLVQFLKLTLSSMKISDDEQDVTTSKLHYNYFVDQISTNYLSSRIGNAIKNQIQYQNSLQLLKQQSIKQKQQKQSVKAQQTPVGQKPQPPTVQQKQQQQLDKMAQEDKRRLLIMKLKHKLLNPSPYSQPDTTNTPSLVLINSFQLGNICCNILKNTLKVKNRYDSMVPLLQVKYKTSRQNNLMYKYFTISNGFMDIINSDIEDTQMFHLDKALPMIMKPAKWVDYQIGGYFLKPTTMIRIENSDEQQGAIKHADLGRTFRILDALSGTPWKINKKVMKVAQQFWNLGEGAPCIPSKNNNSEIVYEHEVFNYYGKQRLKIIQQLQKQKDAHGMRCDFLLKLGVIKSFQNIQNFYYPMSLDFRGRVYPISPHFNHIGADLSRGLLKFGEKKKVGAGGLRWLKIHCANLMGQDKKPIKDKLIFLQNNIQLIRKIAQNPMQNRQWLDNQDCWQLLGTIFELTDALALDNPQQFMSDLHIHQDGSCNGLQHYAALGRDAEGAAQVNLDKRDLPGDVYTFVMNMVKQKILEDAKNPDNQYYTIANILKDEIKRKTVKQTVMTSVYGVTFIGAKSQIQRQLKDQKIFSDPDQEYKAAIYLAKYTLQSIANLFSGANAIKKWLIQCAGLICNTGNSVSWITPYGLPVIQSYRSANATDSIKMMSEQISTNIKFDEFPVNKSRQKSAFPPNFVHSLDSSHMIYTAEQCLKKNITFAAVHDSYWTHPSTVDQMNSILRQQFIRLHSQPILQNLRTSFQRRYPMLYFPPVPMTGDFNLERVKQSLYFFS